MKKIFLYLVFMISISFADAQRWVISGGYNLSYYPKINNFNSIIHDYNTTRTWLTQKMDTVSLMQGFVVGLGIDFESLGVMELTFVGRHVTKDAYGIEPASGKTGNRELKLRANTFNTSYGYKLGRFFMPGISLDVGWVYAQTHSWRTGEEKQDFFNTTDYPQLGASGFIQFNLPLSEKFAISVKPYYHAQLYGVDFYNTQSVINNVVITQLNKDYLHNYGVEMKMVITTK